MSDTLRDLATKSPTKIVLLVLDGLGGLPREPGGTTELETARTPNLDALAAKSECGLHVPIGYGITPGSAPGHLSLFGYDPLAFPIGRGVVAAMGIGFPMKAGDVAARLNFASLDAAGAISDRRAGRIPTEKCAELCGLLKAITIKGVEVSVKPVKDYRAVVVFRGKGLSDALADTDPQVTGVPPLDPVAHDEKARHTAEVAKEFVAQARKILASQSPANGVLLRGFAELPHIPSLKERHGLSMRSRSRSTPTTRAWRASWAWTWPTTSPTSTPRRRPSPPGGRSTTFSSSTTSTRTRGAKTGTSTRR